MHRIIFGVAVTFDGRRDRLNWRNVRRLWAGWKPIGEKAVEQFKDLTLENGVGANGPGAVDMKNVSLEVCQKYFEDAAAAMEFITLANRRSELPIHAFGRHESRKVSSCRCKKKDEKDHKESEIRLYSEEGDDEEIAGE